MLLSINSVDKEEIAPVRRSLPFGALTEFDVYSAARTYLARSGDLCSLTQAPCTQTHFSWHSSR
jgi:hypothetical protein